MAETEGIALLDIYLVSALAVLVLVIGIAFFIVAYQRKVMGQKMVIQDQERAHQVRLLEAATEAQERERARLAQELHDGVGATLSGARMGLKQFARKMDPNDEQANHLVLLHAMLDEGLETVRSVSRDLMPAQLSKTGLFSVLTSLVDRLNQASPAEIKLEGQDPGRLPEAIELGLYRIAQELLSNGIRHSQASGLTLKLMAYADEISLTYQDNGVGMLYERTQPGVGLQSMESRVKVMKGTWDVESAPGQGVQIRITIKR